MLSGWFCASYYYTAVQVIKKTPYSSENRTEYIEVGRRGINGGKRDVLVSGIINRGDDFNAKVQKAIEFLSGKRSRKNMKYIDNGNIGLGMLNRSKLHYRFGTIQLFKNYRQILKTWPHKEKPANKSILLVLDLLVKL